jgi:hypothetical protein
MRSTCWTVAAILAGLTAATASAEDFTCDISPYSQYQFKSDYGQASVTITRVGLDLDHSFTLNPRTTFSTSAKIEESVYNFNDFRHESPGVKTPIDTALLLRLAPTVTYAINDQWLINGGLIGQASGQTGADFGDSLSVGVLGMVVHKFSDTLSIGLGAVFYTQLEDSATILPIESIDWKFAEHWMLTGRGTEVRVSYSTQPAITYYLAGSYATRQYRLEGSADYSGGALTDDSIPIRLGLQWNPSSQVTVSGEVGAIAWQELTFDDSDGHRIVKDTVDPTIFLGFQFRYQF